MLKLDHLKCFFGKVHRVPVYHRQLLLELLCKGRELSVLVLDDLHILLRCLSLLFARKGRVFLQELLFLSWEEVPESEVL